MKNRVRKRDPPWFLLPTSIKHHQIPSDLLVLNFQKDYTFHYHGIRVFIWILGTERGPVGYSQPMKIRWWLASNERCHMELFKIRGERKPFHLSQLPITLESSRQIWEYLAAAVLTTLKMPLPGGQLALLAEVVWDKCSKKWHFPSLPSGSIFIPWRSHCSVDLQCLLQALSNRDIRSFKFCVGGRGPFPSVWIESSWPKWSLKGNWFPLFSEKSFHSWLWNRVCDLSCEGQPSVGRRLLHYCHWMHGSRQHDPGLCILAGHYLPAEQWE